MLTLNLSIRQIRELVNEKIYEPSKQVMKLISQAEKLGKMDEKVNVIIITILNKKEKKYKRILQISKDKKAEREYKQLSLF